VRRPRSPHARTSLGALAALVALTGCGAGQLQFHNDHRLSFTSPSDNQKVKAPVTVSWTMRDFQATGLDGSTSDRSGTFAVFVDRAPLPVGKDLRWLARDDSGCKRDPRCPDAEYLSSRGVFLTTRPTLTLDVLPRVGDGKGKERHFVNVVLLDGTGHRIGESAWYRSFTSDRRSV
jgi:hypothetical protein